MRKFSKDQLDILIKKMESNGFRDVRSLDDDTIIYGNGVRNLIIVIKGETPKENILSLKAKAYDLNARIWQVDLDTPELDFDLF